MALKVFFLDEHELASEHEEEDGEGRIERSILHLMHKILLAEIVPPCE